MKKRANANRAVRRIGANRQKLMEEQRIQRPRLIGRILKRVLGISAAAALAVAAGCAAFTYGPAAVTTFSDSSKRLPPNIKIKHCGLQTQERLKCALDSLITADSLAFGRPQVLMAAAAIPEIEKISVGKTKDRKSREKTTVIKVTERKPVALVHCGDIYLVDKKGVRFDAKTGRYYDLPLLIISSAAPRDTVDLEVFNQIKKTLRNLDKELFQQVSQVDVSGEAVSLFFKTGEAEYVINSADIEKKMIYVKELRERLLEEHGEPARIDMRYRSLAYSSAQ